MECDLTLCVVARNKSTLKYDILSIDKEKIIYPSFNVIPNKNIKDQLYELTKKYIRIEDNVLQYIFLDIEVKTNINILYFCCVPIDIDLENSYFLPIDNNIKNVKNLQKIISII